MEPAALVFLKPEQAQRLAVTWQHLTRDRTPRAWAAAAGVPERVAEEVGRILKLHAICRKDGTTDPIALRFIAMESAPWLKKQVPRK